MQIGNRSVPTEKCSSQQDKEVVCRKEKEKKSMSGYTVSIYNSQQDDDSDVYKLKLNYKIPSCCKDM